MARAEIGVLEKVPVTNFETTISLLQNNETTRDNDEDDTAGESYFGTGSTCMDPLCQPR